MLLDHLSSYPHLPLLSLPLRPLVLFILCHPSVLPQSPALAPRPAHPSISITYTIHSHSYSHLSSAPGCLVFLHSGSCLQGPLTTRTITTAPPDLFILFLQYYILSKPIRLSNLSFRFLCQHLAAQDPDPLISSIRSTASVFSSTTSLCSLRSSDQAISVHVGLCPQDFMPGNPLATSF